MKRILLVSTAICTLALSGCDKGGPCSGGGKSIDDGPVTEAWKAAGGLPEGAVACKFGEEEPYPLSKSYELGANVDEGYTKSIQYYGKKGWTHEQKHDETYQAAVLAKDGHTLEVQCSRKVEDKGWCTATFTEKK
jgi:hypothetical protein